MGMATAIAAGKHASRKRKSLLLATWGGTGKLTRHPQGRRVFYFP
jgi:hypothetical protein